MTGVLIREGKFGHRHKKEGDHMKTEVEIGVLMPQAKEHLELPEAERRILLSRRGFGGSVANA